jgi:TonB family protein
MLIFYGNNFCYSSGREEQPMFPGGEEARKKYLEENFRYPQRAIDSGIEGIVYVTFTVEVDGSISNVVILRGIRDAECPECDEEAIRLVEGMPNWTPGRQRPWQTEIWETVRVRLSMPIKFSLDEELKKNKIKVKYISKDVDKRPIYFINGKIQTYQTIIPIDPAIIDNVRVEKEELEIEGKKYYGQIFINLKNEFNFRLISLVDLAKKHTNIENGLTVFMIDDELIKGDYEQYLVDVKYLLQIIVDTTNREGQSINVVRLLTKTKENIVNSKKTRIR